MPGKPGLLVAAGFAVAVAALASFTAIRPSLVRDPGVGPDLAQAGSPPTGPAAARPAPSRPGRVLTAAEARRELELIQPSRAKRAEDFDVPMAGQGTFRLSEHRGKLVMVNFWATWCPPCLEEMPALERLYRQHRESGFVLVAVSVDTDPGKVGPFMTARRLTFPVGLDPKTRVAELYGVRALPSTFLIDREGNLSALALGPRAWDGDASHSLVEALSK
jgi:peroxiredoxin